MSFDGHFTFSRALGQECAPWTMYVPTIPNSKDKPDGHRPGLAQPGSAKCHVIPVSDYYMGLEGSTGIVARVCRYDMCAENGLLHAFITRRSRPCVQQNMVEVKYNIESRLVVQAQFIVPYMSDK